MIPTGAFVTEYTGRIKPVQSPGQNSDTDEEEDDDGSGCERSDEQHDDDDEYIFDLAPRPYAECEKVRLPLLPCQKNW